MAAAPRDMTTGELEVRLDGLESNILAAIKTIQDNMVTKAVFDVQQKASDERVNRLAEDHQAWVRESTEAHVSLDKDSKARHQETIALVEKKVAESNVALEKVNARIDDSNEKTALKFKERDKRREDDEKDLKSARRAVFNLWIAGGITIVVSIIVKFLPNFGS